MTKKILVADDDPSIIESIKLILEDEGYVVETSMDGATLCKIIHFSPDLILLDIWMSGEDGREICQLIKADPAIKQVPVILISANRDTQKFARESGADDFLEKPFEIDDLLDKVQKHITTSL